MILVKRLTKYKICFLGEHFNLSIQRHNTMTPQESNTQGVNNMRMTKLMKRCKWILATGLFVFVLMIGMVCFAEETPGTVLGESCNIRETADTNGRVLGSAKKGQTVSICDEVTGTDGKIWYQVFVDANTKGYIRSDLVKKSDNAATTTTETNLPATQVTPTDAKAATVVTNNVRIRKGASTQYDYVATANKGMSLTVNGETTGSDGKLWYQVVFNYNNKEITGFVRNDLVSFGSVPADTVSSEITGTTENPEETTETPQTEENAEPEPVQEEEPRQETNSQQSQNMILMNVEETPYLMPGFVPIILKWEEQDINAYKNGSFYIFYAQSQTGEQGWYVFDSSMGTYQRYAYAVEGVSSEDVNSTSFGMLPIIILAVVIVILLVVIGLLLIRLREYTADEYDDEDEDDEEEELDEESIVEEVEEVQIPERQNPKRRPRPQNRENVEPKARMEEDVPVRRPQERQENSQRPVRRQPQSRPEGARTENSRPVRRPDSSAPVRREAERPVRNANGEMPRRRSDGMGQGPAKRPSGQPNQRRVNRPEQQGYKAQSFIENEDQNDLEFIDL